MDFSYRSIDKNGEVRIGAIAADSADSAMLTLADQGLILVELREGKKDVWAWLYEPRGSKHRVDRRDVQEFLKDMGQLIRSGIQLESALRLAGEIAEKPGVKAVIRKLRDDIRSGANFSDACAQHRDVFSQHMVAAFRAAEKTGQLETALSQLSQSEEQILKFRDKLVSDMIYPCILFGMVMLTFLLVVFVVLPGFEPLFDMAGDDVPTMTRMVVSFGGFVRHYGLLLLILLAAGVVGAITLLQTPAVRLKLDAALLDRESLRAWLLPPDLIRASQILGSSLSVGVRIDVALRLTADSAMNTRLRETFIEASEAVRRGERLAVFLAGQDYIPRLFVHFVKIGEETGSLGKMCLEVSSHISRGFEKRLDRLLAILPPVVTLVLGGMIAVLVGSILLGMISLNRAVL